jgi:multisubunit Na+/H+ antiporter MnhB subunit
MSKTLKVIYYLTFIGLAAAIVTEWLLGNHITWPTIALFWAYQSFSMERKINKLNEGKN